MAGIIRIKRLLTILIQTIIMTRVSKAPYRTWSRFHLYDVANEVDSGQLISCHKEPDTHWPGQDHHPLQWRMLNWDGWCTSRPRYRNSSSTTRRCTLHTNSLHLANLKIRPLKTLSAGLPLVTQEDAPYMYGGQEKTAGSSLNKAAHNTTGHHLQLLGNQVSF